MDISALDTVDRHQLGRELQRARKRRGLTQEEAAAVIDVTRTTMVAIEQGSRRLKPAELIKLADAYSCHLHDLLRRRPDVESLDVQFRGPFVRTEQDEREIQPSISVFEDLCRNYLELEHLTGSRLVRKYPEEYQYAGQPLDVTTEAIALEERARLGLGDRPIPMLRDVLEQDVGLRIFYIPMPRRFSEIYAYTDDLGGCMAINQIHPEERRRWSLAHGYFHFLSSRRSAEVEVDGALRRQSESERFADAFARYFLIPSASLTRRFLAIKSHAAVTPSTLAELANYYGVSMEALIQRLETMHLLPSGMWERLRSFKWGELKHSLGLAPVPAREQKLPVHYVYLAIEAFMNGSIGEGELARFLEVDRVQARRIAAQIVPTGEDSNMIPRSGTQEIEQR